MEIKQAEAAIEAILFAMGDSVELEKIAKAIQQDTETTRKIIGHMMDGYRKKERGIRIMELDGAYQLCTKQELYPYLIRVARQPKKLVLIWTHCKNMLCEEDRLEWKKVFQNVNIISIIVGVILFISKIRLPSGVQDVMDMMNNMIGPIGMLLAGMVIADVPLKTVFTKKRNYVSTVLRLIVYPVFILILMKLIYTFAGLNDSKQILLTGYIASITPACATVTSIAQLYDKDAAYASALYVLTTLLSIVTMPVMVECMRYLCERIEKMKVVQIEVETYKIIPNQKEAWLCSRNSLQ